MNCLYDVSAICCLRLLLFHMNTLRDPQSSTSFIVHPSAPHTGHHSSHKICRLSHTGFSQTGLGRWFRQSGSESSPDDFRRSTRQATSPAGSGWPCGPTACRSQKGLVHCDMSSLDCWPHNPGTEKQKMDGNAFVGLGIPPLWSVILPDNNNQNYTRYYMFGTNSKNMLAGLGWIHFIFFSITVP